MPMIDDLVRLLRDNEVGLWCKRAAWLIAIVNTVLVLFQLLGLLVHADLATLPIALLTTLLGYVVTTLWYFFVLYALGAIVDRLMA
jgi:cellulose synthase/poly-beta-1,6-N-acetylglucosamine synthase-like glycosyltransferase